MSTTTAADIISQIPLDDLHDSPFNPRRSLTGIDELAASIKAEGCVHEPLLVRPRMTRPTAAKPDDMFDGYEIVFGHRRARAAELAGLTRVPCMVRAMSESEARSAQIAENLQRENVHALEEAESFRQLIEADGISADALAERLGKSRSHVYGRLKLNALCADVRKACLAGEIGSEAALLVARLRTDKFQAKALQYIRARNQSLADGGKESYRRIRAILAERFNTALKSAIFPADDATLLPDAGACGTCPKRAGNAPEFADIAESKDHSHWQRDMYGADVCTDPDCFDAKKRAHLKRQAEALQAKGKTVVDGNAARAALSADGQVKGAYIALKDVKAELKKLGAKKTVATGDPTPAVALIQDPRTGKTVEAVKREDLTRAGVKLAAPGKEGSYDRHKAQEARRAAEQKRLEARVAVERKVRAEVLEQVRSRMATTERSAFDLRLIAKALLGHIDYQFHAPLARLWDAKDLRALHQRVDTFDLQPLALLALDCALIGNLRVSTYNLDHEPATTLLAAAAHYGVDVEQVRAVVAGAGVPAPEPEEAAA